MRFMISRQDVSVICTGLSHSQPTSLSKEITTFLRSAISNTNTVNPHPLNNTTERQMSNLERFFRIWGLIVIITSFGDMVLHAITDKDIWVYIFYAHFGIFICS